MVYSGYLRGTLELVLVQVDKTYSLQQYIDSSLWDNFTGVQTLLTSTLILHIIPGTRYYFGGVSGLLLSVFCVKYISNNLPNGTTLEQAYPSVRKCDDRLGTNMSDKRSVHFPKEWYLSSMPVCVFFTLNRSFYPSTFWCSVGPVFFFHRHR